MASHNPSDGPLKELKHDAVPGYPMIFTICFAAMTIYLGFILISSPGQVEYGKGHGYEKKGAKSHSEKTETKKEAH